jgi:hypothetical protein
MRGPGNVQMVFRAGTVAADEGGVVLFTRVVQGCDAILVTGVRVRPVGEEKMDDFRAPVHAGGVKGSFAIALPPARCIGISSRVQEPFQMQGYKLPCRMSR